MVKTRQQNDTEVKIQVKDLNFYYGSVQALFGITMDIPARQVTALIGPSGCGKSTFLRALNRMNDIIDEARTDGEVLIDGKNIYDRGTDIFKLRKKVGMVFQKSNPFPKSIFENVAYGPRIHSIQNRKELSEIVETSLVRAALWDEVKDRLDKNAMDLSGGQQQRLCIVDRPHRRPHRRAPERLYNCDCDTQYAAGCTCVGFDCFSLRRIFN